MKRLMLGSMLFSAVAVLAIATGEAQPPEGKGGKRGRQGDDKGPPGGGPPRFELGRVLPPFVMDELDLTEEQQAQIAALERQVKTKLEKILTPEQQKKVKKLRPPGPPRGGPDDRPEGGKERPDGPPPGKDRQRPPDDKEAAAGGIQWFTSWVAGKEEAARTARPILLVSAAPHCAGVSGIW